MCPGHPRRVRSSPLRLAAFALLTLAPIALTACSERGSAEQTNSPVTITPRGTQVSIANMSGQPLSGVVLTVVPFGQSPYSKPLGSLEMAEQKNVGLAELKAENGSTFNPMLVRPKLVKLTATDPTGRQYDVEMPWR